MLILFAIVGALIGGVLGRAFRRWRASRAAGRGEKIDLLLLLRAPRIITAEHLRAAAREAFGGEPDAVTERTPGGKLTSDGYGFLVFPAPEPMVKGLEEAAEGIAELRMRVAFLEHRAFVVVSCVERPKEATRADAYARVGRLAAALVDDTTSLVYAPEVQRGLLINEETLAGLRSGDPLEAMHTMTFDPIGLVSGEDPRMVESTAEARRRLPEFVAAFQATVDHGSFLVKGPFTDGTHTEFMWVEPMAIEGAAIRGTLANAPFQVRGLRHGSAVEVAFGEVSDWVYVGADGPIGMFTERIVRGAIA